MDKYFQHFEKIASNLEWPIEAWPTVLQTVLKGKVQVTYASLSITDSANNDTVKRAILRSYEMVPEAYRQRFSGYRMSENQTYVEFFRQKETYLDRWIARVLYWRNSLPIVHPFLSNLGTFSQFYRYMYFFFFLVTCLFSQSQWKSVRNSFYFILLEILWECTGAMLYLWSGLQRYFWLEVSNALQRLCLANRDVQILQKKKWHL